MDSSKYYDSFISYQIKSGLNDRIYHLYKRIRKLGLKSDTNLLEIGCGIGTLTNLLSREIRKGIIEAIDISPKSVEFAKQHIKKSNLNFYSSDIMAFEPTISKFDRILLFDVLEHILEEDHAKLFIKIEKWMNDDSLLLINLPNPYYILYDEKHNPELLQETDQPIFVDKIAKSLAEAMLDIVYLETYSIWVKDDYIFLLVRKKSEFKENIVSSNRTLICKILYRLNRIYRRFIYNYPPNI